MQTDLYNRKGDKVGTVDLADRVFGQSWNVRLVHQALRVFETNKRKSIANAKGRGEVRGGGRKPWQQKGTGRARHGSIRSPIWIGGGATHGPTSERVYSLKINKKMRQKAMFSVLSRRLADGEVRIVDSLSIEEPKTKLLADAISKLAPRENALIVVASENKNVFQAGINLEKVTVMDAKMLNVFDLLRHSLILIEKEALGLIDTHYHAAR